MRRIAIAAFAVIAIACEPREEAPPKHPEAKCPPPPEPAYVATVVGTIGKLHLVESRYPLSRIGDVLTVAKPDLVLIGAVPDHDDAASFEMAYARFVAKEHGAALESVDWGAAIPHTLPPFTFEQANGDELARKMIAGTDPEGAPRAAKITQRIAEAIDHQMRPKRVVAVVNVTDRPLVDSVLHELGYTTRSPVDIVNGSKETMAGDIPPEVVAEWSRARTTADGDRAKVLDLAIEKRGACCVARSALP